MRGLALAVVLSGSFVRGAAAQSGDQWLIVPVATSAGSSVEAGARGLHEELSALGVKVWSPEDAATRFEAAGSVPAPTLSDGEKAAWVEQSKEALEQLVRGDPEGAIQRIRDGELLSIPTVVSLNRVPGQARQVLDTCMLAVRALLESGSMDETRATARECRRLVVAGDPTPNMHPPPVVALLDAADDYRASQATVLHVSSKPSGCAVRVNGAVLGETPLKEPALVPGRYAVQVECGPEWRGRVHYTNVQPGFTELQVDARFEEALTTRPVMGLHYSDSLEAQEHRQGDAVKVVEAVPSIGLVIMSALDTSTLELELLRGPALRRAAFVKMKGTKGDPTRGDTTLAARTLIDGKCMDLTTLPPTDLPCGGEDATAAASFEHHARMPRGKFISGITLFAAGSASLLTGYVLFAPRARTSEDWVRALDAGQPSASLQQKWFNVGVGQVVVASVGGAALVTAMPLALPKREKAPWWAWLSGGVGVGLASFSIAYGVTAKSEPVTPCSNLIADADDARTCVERGEHIALAVLTGATAAPLLSIPLVYALRRSRSRLIPEVEVSPSGAYFALQGAF